MEGLDHGMWSSSIASSASFIVMVSCPEFTGDFCGFPFSFKIGNGDSLRYPASLSRRSLNILTRFENLGRL